LAAVVGSLGASSKEYHAATYCSDQIQTETLTAAWRSLPYDYHFDHCRRGYNTANGLGFMRSFLVVAVVASASISGAAQAADISSGSGVVIGVHGEVLTNAHVVEACRTITVKLASRNSETAVLVTRDERNDLAVVRINGTNNLLTSVAAFREGAPIRAGDSIVALGYPLPGLLATDANVSIDSVSALSGIADDSRYLQISAPVRGRF
jgi:S1-C subfamily serine protease